MRPLACLLLAAFLPSCVHVFTTRHAYQAPGPAPSVGGSAFRAEFLPQGTESGVALSAMVVGGALVHEVGPYQVRLHAFGQPGDQKWFEVRRLRITSADSFVAPMEPRGFAGQAEFQPTQTTGRTRASLLLGPNIRLDDKKQRDIVLELDVSVMRRSGPVSGSMRIPMTLTKTRRRESTFLLAEIWRDMSRRNTMADLPQALPPPPETAD